ncbi:toprim domain-containing protein [Micromonospora sp. WMMD1082]|uniref:toprim domain-containing protein n=1 Tax=Micromonospora sp. WMMD1082 TaxID=3016104 RepID=UPI0024170C90|nr:toprim domain-containing protein [Micromonospora sp. WMMD1082]MDG4793127.1 toprim domain-containing protein [Micromonospora sp. WMMD1082]
MPGERPAPPPERLYAVNAAAAQFYASRLPVSRKAARYLHSHGINTAADPTGPWQVGYAPGRWTELATHLRAAGFTDEEVTGAGLGFIHNRSGHLLDRFRDRLMFPVTDVHNRVVGFTARDLGGRAEAKWLNTPETAIYRKRLLLYGLGQQLANRPAGIGDPIVFVVEGAADVLAMHRMAAAHAAIPETQPLYAVAPCGTNLTRDQLDLIQQTLPGAHLILAFDGDDAGRRAADRVYPVASRWPGQVSGIRLPEGQDPADMLGAMDPVWAISEIIGAVQPLAQVQMTNTIDRLFATKRITDPVRFVEDRITAYRAIAELFVDAPHATRDMAEAAAERLGLASTDVARGVIEAWSARTDTPGGTDPPPDTAAPPSADEPAAGPPAEVPTPSSPSHGVAETDITVSATAHNTGSRRAGTTAAITRYDPSSGITVWALADGIGRHAQAATAAQMAADIAATVSLRSTPAAGLHGARAAINAFYSGVHPSQAGDASLLVVSAYPSPTHRHGVRWELAWAGDCRAYTIRAGQLAQVTADHTAAWQRRDQGEHPSPGIADVLLTSSIRAGDISVCPLDEGPLLLCNNGVHRAIPERQLAAELAGMSDAQASADRLARGVGQHNARDATVLLIHARSAPPALVTTTRTNAHATVTASGSPAALAKTSFTDAGTGPAAVTTPQAESVRGFGQPAAGRRR